jgi:hypothetical protein
MLEAWQQRVCDEGQTPEPLLFIALLCGTQFRVFHVEVWPVLDELREWLTSRPRLMPAELAEVLLEALSPAIADALSARGWQAGPEGKPIEVRGRPRENTGAWAAGVLTELYLRGTRAGSAAARQLAEGLVSALVGRAVATREFSTARKPSGRPETLRLLEALMSAYDALVELEARRRLAPRPPASDPPARAKWLAMFQSLPHTLAVDGADTLARKALAELKPEIWAVLTSPPPRRASNKAPPRAKNAP